MEVFFHLLIQFFFKSLTDTASGEQPVAISGKCNWHFIWYLSSTAILNLETGGYRKEKNAEKEIFLCF